LADRYGSQILARITGAYGVTWPASGYPVHFSGFTNWAGAYSTDGPLLVISSFTYVAAARRAHAHDRRGLRSWVALTFVLGAAFLVLQLVDYARLSFSVSSDAFGKKFFAMTGFHAAHVVAGLILMLVVLGRSTQGAYDAGEPLGVEAVGYYWHFVDVVWIVLYATLYLLR